MEIAPEQRMQIRSSFTLMKTKEDFLELLNVGKKILYGSNFRPFELRQLNYYINPSAAKVRYRSFEILKKSGKNRVIHSPVPGLKSIQRCICFILQQVYEPTKVATAFIEGRSVVNNGKMHCGQNYVLNLDLVDFFPSIDQGRVWGRLQLEPFFLNKKNKNLEIANMIAILCCHPIEVDRPGKGKVIRSVLPQGAPTSPVLSNAICQQLDFYLSAVARRFGANYSRYADDITFSSQHNLYRKGSDFMTEWERVVVAQGFKVNQSKTRLRNREFSQQVTGLVVNQKPNLKKEYVKQLRVWLKNWEVNGYTTAAKVFMPSHDSNRSYIKSSRREFSKVIEGKLNYMKMVKGEDDGTYCKLLTRFKALIENKTKALGKVSKTATQPQILAEYEVLVKLEVKGSPNVQSRLLQPISIASDTLIPSVMTLLGVAGKRVAQAPRLKTHDPIYTIKFLKQFKTGDGTGFKELVHEVNLESFTVDEIMRRIKTHPNFYYHYQKEYLSEVSFLNKGIQQEVIGLATLFENRASKFYLITGKHPFHNDQIYTEFAKKFKKKYRYGSGEEYSVLSDDINEILEHYHLSNINVCFLPDLRIFNIRANFFTWRPSIIEGLKYLISGISDHSNNDGHKSNSLNNDKMLEFKVSREGNSIGSFVELTILDRGSLAMIDPNTLREYLHRSQAFTDLFRYLCDWRVECDFVEYTSLAFDVLTAGAQPEESIFITELKEKVGGFKHILRFYDAI